MHTIEHLIDLALAEDVGPGDITTDNLVGPHLRGIGTIKAKESFVLAGLDVAKQVFLKLNPDMAFQTEFTDGDIVEKGRTVLTASGSLQALLKAERTALNFLQRLSGIATNVRAYVAAVGDSGVRLVDTRKTLPGWRVLDKYAVRVGGAFNHRTGLYDGVLIKDNHIAVSGGIAAAVNRIRHRVSHLVRIEVETTDMEEVQQALDAGADVIMLDNMTPDQIKAAAALINKKAVVEVSGGVSRKNLAELARTGVDIISIGALTHSATSVDISMYITKTG